ncbi:PIN domain-containing protein [Haloferula chungangensis]|uniref:PIN domain-containing protein n=1 Tax=Haloferula chungangensis TaxID=1048331 RepID=A0ABW2LBP3_9BACT
MSAPSSYFLDTNILVYAFTEQDEEKKQITQQLIHDDQPWLISWQVVQEFCSVALHNRIQALPKDVTETLIELLLGPRCRVFPSPAIWQNAIGIHAQTQYRFYDSLIVAAAMEAGVATLYSEDLQHGRRFGQMTIANPFL